MTRRKARGQTCVTFSPDITRDRSAANTEPVQVSAARRTMFTPRELTGGVPFRRCAPTWKATNRWRYDLSTELRSARGCHPSQTLLSGRRVGLRPLWKQLAPSSGQTSSSVKRRGSSFVGHQFAPALPAPCNSLDAWRHGATLRRNGFTGSCPVFRNLWSMARMPARPSVPTPSADRTAAHLEGWRETARTPRAMAR
jgi:hypothetical protein